MRKKDAAILLSAIGVGLVVIGALLGVYGRLCVVETKVGNLGDEIGLLRAEVRELSQSGGVVPHCVGAKPLVLVAER